MTFVRRHSLALAVLALGVAAMGSFSWAEWGYFRDQAASHHEHARFWSSEHVHDWLYNAASNWQSELLFGVMLVLLLRDLGAREEPADERGGS